MQTRPAASEERRVALVTGANRGIGRRDAGLLGELRSQSSMVALTPTFFSHLKDDAPAPWPSIVPCA
jgi:hypothetical protein